jgi:hypothetical protein
MRKFMYLVMMGQSASHRSDDLVRVSAKRYKRNPEGLVDLF